MEHGQTHISAEMGSAADSVATQKRSDLQKEPFRKRREGSMPIKPLHMAAAVLMVAVLRMRQRSRSKPAPVASDWLTAAAASPASPEKETSDPISTGPPPKTWQLASLLALLSTTVIAAVIALLCLRGAPDLAVVVALAWTLHMLQLKVSRQLLGQPKCLGDHIHSMTPIQRTSLCILEVHMVPTD